MSDAATSATRRRRFTLTGNSRGEMPRFDENIHTHDFSVTLEPPASPGAGLAERGIKPAGKAIVAAQRWHRSTLWQTCSQTQTVGVKISTWDRMVLEWDRVDGIIEAGHCDLIQFPHIETPNDTHVSREDVETLSMIIEELVRQHGLSVEKLRDVSGAGLIHCLAIANTEKSIELAMNLFQIRPLLLLCVHSGGRGGLAGYFDGEGALHILAVNKKEDEFRKLVELAHAEFKPPQFEELLLQKTRGAFFRENVPMFGATPLACAAADHVAPPPSPPLLGGAA